MRRQLGLDVWEGGIKWEDPLADARRYAYEGTPRVSGLAHTAPKYDSVTAPTTAPVPTSCLASKTKCSCYSQQTTVMDVPEYLCREIIAKGFFVDFELDCKRFNQDNSRQAFEHPDAYLVRADSVPVVPDRTAEVSQAPATDDVAGYGVLGARRDKIRQPES